MSLTKLGVANPERDGKLETITVASGMLIEFTCTEFTCFCPVTGQPDWATIVITLETAAHTIESKSLKLYMETWRDEPIFHEHLAQAILDDVVDAVRPVRVTVTVHFNVRGGIAITAAASWEDPEWNA